MFYAILNISKMTAIYTIRFLEGKVLSFEGIVWIYIIYHFQFYTIYPCQCLVFITENNSVFLSVILN